MAAAALAARGLGAFLLQPRGGAISQVDAGRLGPEPANHLARQPAAEVLVRPRPVHLVDAIDPLEEVRDPPDAPRTEGDRELPAP